MGQRRNIYFYHHLDKEMLEKVGNLDQVCKAVWFNHC